MRRMISASVLTALVLLIPAAPAAAQAEVPGRDAACQTVERKLFKDIRELITIDLDTATDTEIRVVANQIQAVAKAESLPVLPGVVQEKLDSDNPDDLRTFLRKSVLTAWTVDLRVSVTRTLTAAGTNVKAAAKKVLDSGTIEVMLAYLNEGLYAARELDCASQPSPSPSVTPSVTPSATTSVSPSVTASASPGAPDGEDEDGSDGGGLPVTGSDTGTVAGVGGALLLLGGVGYLIGRRRRSRFVA